VREIETRETKRRIEAILEYYGVPSPIDAAKKLNEYLLLLEKNRKWAKLTSSGFKVEREKALADSLAVGKAIGFGKAKSVADLGAGG